MTIKDKTTLLLMHKYILFLTNRYSLNKLYTTLRLHFDSYARPCPLAHGFYDEHLWIIIQNAQIYCGLRISRPLLVV